MTAKRNINLDLIRVFAAFMVLSVHIGQYTGREFVVGAKGVQLFFVISGYLAFASMSNKSVSQYYKSRVLRILPTYYFCIALVYFADIVMAIQDGVLGEVLKGQCSIRFLRYVFFLQCFIPSDNWNMWNNHNALWTMSSFIGFYLLAPWIYRIIKNTYVGMAVVFLAMISRPWMIETIKRTFSNYPEEAHIEWFASMNPLTELYCFLLGAVLYIAIRESRQYLYLLVLLLGLIVSSVDWYKFEIVFVVLAALSVLCKNITSNTTISKFISWLSNGSFTLYLIHPLVLVIAKRNWYKLGIENETIHGIVLYACCIAVSYFMHYCVISRIEKGISSAA